MNINNIDSLNTAHAFYYWPDVNVKNKLNHINSKLILDRYNYKFKDYFSSIEISKCLKLAGMEIGNLPRLYYGIFSKKLLNKIKDNFGSYFPGPSPDMASSFAAALLVDSYKYYDAPIFIAGNSRYSAAGLGLAGKHVGEIKGNLQLPKDAHLVWDKLIPKFWSGHTIYAETISKVIGNKSLSINRGLTINYIFLYASCLVFSPNFKNEVLISIRNYSVKRNKYIIGFFIQLFISVVWFLRIKSFSRNIGNRLIQIFKKDGTKIHSHINNIEEAALVINKMLDKQINHELF